MSAEAAHSSSSPLLAPALLLGAAAASFALQNSPLGPAYAHIFHTPLFTAGVPIDLHAVINEFLMAIFFLVVGLELKREAREGPFRNPRAAALPVAGALGGVIMPALVFVAIAAPTDISYTRGWAIPAATDIAFALGALAFVAPRAPAPLRLFLLALAVADDLAAILIIAFFYAGTLSAPVLGAAAAVFVAMLAMNKLGIRALSLYWLLGAALWALTFASGIHPTIAGVLTAFAIPMRSKGGRSPLKAAEKALTPWAERLILPLFALANAGVALGGEGLSAALHPVALAIAGGLVIGKPLGIMLGVALAARALKARWPGTPAAMLGVAALSGIGFTMSLFIGDLAFREESFAAPVRLGVLGGSLLAATLGAIILQSTIKAPVDKHEMQK